MRSNTIIFVTITLVLLLAIQAESRSRKFESLREDLEGDHHGGKKGKKGHDDHHWGYKQNGDDWKGKCMSGKRQSPVDISSDDAESVSSSSEDQSKLAFTFNYKNSLSGLKATNNGHTIQFDGVSNMGSVVRNGETYDVKQFHVHAPSEHTIDGQSYPLEIHIVHQKQGAKGLEGLLVVGFMYEQGEDKNKFLSQIGWNKLPKKTKKSKKIMIKKSDLDLSAIFGENDLNSGAFYSYSGSLTTPPCAEDVQFNIFKTPLTMSSNQVDAINKLYSENLKFADGNGNNRNVQPLNGRAVKLVNGETSRDGPDN